MKQRRLEGWIDKFLRAVGQSRRHRRIRVGTGVVKVNVGAGVETADGWMHVDGGLHALVAGAPPRLLKLLHRRTHTVRRIVSEDEYVRRLRAHSFIFHNLEYGLPFESNSVDFIFCSHVLEHFYLPDAKRLIAEMLRVLKPGGYVRLCVPDLAKAVELYQRGDKEGALAYFFTDSRAGSYDEHHYMYDFELLEKVLREQGFTDITKCAYREGHLPDLEKLDNRAEQTLFVEARKPAHR